MGERPQPERGSVLLLVPAGVLVLVVLGAVALDFALAFLGQRELSSAAAAAANDVAAAAVSDAAFYGGGAGSVELDLAQAERVATEAVRRRASSGVEVTAVSVRVDGPHACVEVVGRVAYLFAPVVAGVPTSVEVRGRVIATAVVGDEGADIPVPASTFCL